MSISNFPPNLQIAIQQGYLERRFEDNLMASRGYRAIAEKEIFVNQIGETITKTRPGLLPAITIPLDPTTITNLDDGLSPTTWSVEQYTLAINEYASTMDLNIVANKVGIADQFLKNASRLGEQAFRSLDLFVQGTLLNAYMSGNTRTTATLGSPGVTISVDDVRGFQYVIPLTGANAGKPNIPVSGSNTQVVQVGANVYTQTGVTVDVSNTSSVAALGGISGTLTFSTNITVLDSTSGNAVISAFGSQIVRPNNRTTTLNLISSDILTLDNLRTASTILRNNGVPDFNGNYNVILSPASLQQLYRDPEFQILFRGTEFKSEEYRNFWIVDAMGLNFTVSNLAPQQNQNGLKVQRPIVTGSECVIEAVFEGEDEVIGNKYSDDDIYDVARVDDVVMVTRGQLDRLKQIVAQSWFFIGGWVAPTDQTINSSVIPTSSAAYYKRAVVIETA